MQYVVKHEIKVSDYNFLRDDVGWGTLKESQAERGLKNSRFLVAVYEGEKILGSGRIVGDGGYIAVISDVMVRKDYQGEGIGKRIVTELLDYIENSASEDEPVKVDLMAAKGKEEFYKKFGFISRPNEIRGAGMEKWIGK